MNGMSYRLENIWLIMVMDCQNVICWRMLGVTWMLGNIGGYGNMGQTGAKVSRMSRVVISGKCPG